MNDGPFPGWVMRAVPGLEHAGENGFFTAFQEHRARHQSRAVTALAALTGGYTPLLAAPLALAGAVAMALLLSPCVAVTLMLVAVLLWRAAQLFGRRVHRRRLPLCFEHALLPRPDRVLWEHLRLVPRGPFELGEALALERLNRELPGRVRLAWCGVAAGGAMMAGLDFKFGAGDVLLLAGVAVAAAGWMPFIVLSSAERTLRRLVEDVTAMRARSAMDQVASAFGNTVVSFAYMPLIAALLLFELGVAYVLLFEGSRLLILRLLDVTGFTDVGLGAASTAAQGVVGVLLCATVFLARRLAADMARTWKGTMTVAAVEVTSLCEPLVETE